MLNGLAVVAGGLATNCVFSLSAIAQFARVQTEFTLYRNSGAPLLGTAPGCCWSYPGAALSASTTQFYANEDLSLVFARWVLVWNPNTRGSPTGVRLVTADLGPVNVAEIARFTATDTGTPVVDAVDITTVLQELTEQKTIAHQTFGNGQWGCKIYGSWIECLWE